MSPTRLKLVFNDYEQLTLFRDYEDDDLLNEDNYNDDLDDNDSM